MATEPTSDSPSKLWELLREPRDLLKEIPEDRFSAEGFYHPDNSHHGTSNVKHSYLLDEDLRRFDAQFFSIKATEANSIDPQQRLLMETVYESLEAAGMSMKQLQGSDTAVYVGVMSADYTDMIGRDVEKFPTYFATGTARSILSNRLSYFFDWHGASMTIDTACSSSLIAMHQAVQTLRAGESGIAVVAGSNLILGPEQYIAESKLQMLSPTGRSRMWDASADGYARGEGVAAVVLKPLSRALADNDHIECVIRETGVNQDGKTPGITMPSATAQARLIRATYSRAGLDISKPSDRPHYFEAHGTGTLAGDPIEAEAINSAFFGKDLRSVPEGPNGTLFVGSIKTVIGHTEGTAGLAAVIKSSLALQSGHLPPNLLFNKLNPKIEPFYQNLKILSATQQWPTLPKNGVRRISVNSFGFGGANCHAILESADSYQILDDDRISGAAGTAPTFSPYIFSAATQSALISTLSQYKEYLATKINSADGIDLDHVAWTLSSRRTTLACRAAIPAAKSLEDLVDKLDQSVQTLAGSSELSSSKPIAAVESILRGLDQSLHSLPRHDAPSWLLRDQLLASAETSEVGTASLSQPLCTAVQIVLVDLLRAAGVKFSAVVGHSSGEIGAAYAAGYLSAHDAIRIAYYRGLHLKSVIQKGAMMAVGTSYEDAAELCALPAFEGRVCVAASNSPSSVTLSGDAEAIEEIKVILDEEKKFTRLLQVDRAYHSHHMQACAAAYTRSLEQCGLKPCAGNTGSDCLWISSVFACDVADVPTPGGTRRFVLGFQPRTARDVFGCPKSSSLRCSARNASNIPCRNRVQEYASGQTIPYTGAMTRGKDSVESFSMGLGFMWELFGDSVVDLPAYNRFTSGRQRADSRSVPLKDLPTYPWDHERIFWHESRLSRAFRARKDKPHQLLGRRILDGAPDHVQWRNLFKRSEIGWLDGHQVQHQTVFPCAGYVSLCIEACLRICAVDGNVQSIELRDFDVGHAMVFDDEDSGIDATTMLSDISRQEYGGQKEIHARFSFFSSPNNETLEMVNHASCRVYITIGSNEPSILPPKLSDDGGYALLDVEEDRFYDALGNLGFGYSGPFRALHKLKRKLGSAQGFIQNPEADTDEPLLIHPALLDSAIQSIMLAFCYPGDSMLRSIYLPTSIGRLVVNPMHCLEFSGRAVSVPFDATASVSTARSLSGDANIYSPSTGFSSKAIQLEGLQTRPLAGMQSTELSIFTELTWNVDRPDSETILANTAVPELQADLLFSLERAAYFYLRTLNDAIPPAKRANLEWHQKRLFAYVDHVLQRVSSGKNPYARAEWAHDTREVIEEILNKYRENADLRLMRAVGENIAAVVRGETTMLEHMIQDNMLNDFYVLAEGMPRYTAYLAAFASQIGHSHPHMHVLEIGAGTGGATKSFLKELGEQFASYTFTDISSGFFEKAADVFSSYSNKMSFKVLDIEKDIIDQGFAEGSFDVIIASLVLHATRNLDRTLQNVRKLLKPGGYLLLLEITENEQMRFGLLFGGLPGWWLGYDDDRALSPCIGLEEWGSLLKQNGFSGIDTVVPHEQKLPVPLSVIVSQAMDSQVAFLRQPLDQSHGQTLIPRLNIIGGGGPGSAVLAKDIQGHLSSRCGTLKFISSPLDIQDADLVLGSTVLCLADIDEPVFKSLTSSKLQGLQKIFEKSTNVLWVTRGARAGDPYARMVVGLGRTVVLEMLHLRLQFLDLDYDVTFNPSAVAEALLRLEVVGTWGQDGQNVALPLQRSIEPEIHLTGTGKYLVPRFRLNQDQNDRYKAARRPVMGLVDTEESSIELCCRTVDGYYEVVEVGQDKASQAYILPLEQTVEIDVIYSVSRAILVANNCHVFPILGKNHRTGEHVLAISPKQASKVVVPTAFVLSGLEISEDEGADALEMLYFGLIGRAVLVDVSAGMQVITMDPHGRFARTIERLSTDKGANLMHLAAVHPKISRSDIYGNLRPVVIPGTKIFIIDMDAKYQYITDAVAQYTSRENCQIISRADVTCSVGQMPSIDCRQDVRAALVDARYTIQSQRLVKQSGEANKTEDGGLKTLGLSTVQSQSALDEFIVSWKSSSDMVPVSIRTIDTHISFQSDKTYWLVGLTGGTWSLVV
ncbi:Hybrid NRPS/PKS enzyme [Apiospora arundinis]